MRPGRPMMRVWSPIVIILGASAPSCQSQSNASVTYSAKSRARTKGEFGALAAHVVGVEAVRNYDVAAPLQLDDIGNIVVICVAVVDEAAFLDQQSPRVRSMRAAGMPAHGPLARNPPDGVDGLRDRPALFVLVLAGRSLPSIAMAGQLVAPFQAVLGNPWGLLEGLGTDVERAGDLVLIEDLRICQ